MAEKVTISFAFDDKVTPRLDVIGKKIKEIDTALNKARNFKVNTRSVSASLLRVNGRLTAINKNLDDIKAKKLFIDTRNTNQKLTGVNTRLNNITTKLGNALGTVKINTGTAQRSLNTMLTKVETIQNALGKTQLNPSKVASPTGAKSGRAAGRDAFAKLRGAFSRTRDPILQVNKALVQFRKEFRAAAKITKGFPGLRTAIKDFQRFEQAIKKIQKANFKNASASFKAFANSLKAASKPLILISQLLQRAEKSAASFRKALGVSLNTLRLLNAILKRTQKGLRDLKTGTKQTTLLGRAFRGLGKRIPLINRFFGGPALPTFIGRIRAARFALVDLTNILKKVGLAQFFEGIKKGIADAANFELLTAQISTLIQGLGPGGAGTVITGGLGAQFDFTDNERGLEGALTALNRLVRDKAVEAGQDIEKTFKAAYDSISSGVPIGDLEKFIDQASKLAVGGVTDISKATKLLLSVFQTTGRDIDNLETQTDSLFTLVRLGRTTVDELSGSLGRVLPIAQAAGVSIDEVGGAISALSAGGLTTAEAVTALRQVLNKIINPSVASTKLARQLGIELNTAAIKAKGLKGVLEEIALATSSNTDVIGNLFPRVRALVGVLSLLRGEGTQTLDDFFDPFANKAGATETAFERLSNTFTITVNKLRAAFTSLRAEIFEGLLPGLTTAAENLKGVFEGIFQPLRDTSDFAGRAFQQIDTLVERNEITPEQGASARGAILAARSQQVGNIFNQFLSQLTNVLDEFVKLIAEAIEISIQIGLNSLADPNSELGKDIKDLFGTILDSFKLIGGELIDDLGKVLQSAVDDFLTAVPGLSPPDRRTTATSRARLAANFANTASGIPNERLRQLTERISAQLIASITAGTIQAGDPIVESFIRNLRSAGGGQGDTAIERLRDLPEFSGRLERVGPEPTLLQRLFGSVGSIDDFQFVEGGEEFDRLRESFFGPNGFIAAVQGFNEQAIEDLKQEEERLAQNTADRFAELSERRDALFDRNIETDFGGIKPVSLEDILGIGGGPAGLSKAFRKEFPGFEGSDLENLVKQIFGLTEDAIEEAKGDPGLNQTAKDGLDDAANSALLAIQEQFADLSLIGDSGIRDKIEDLLAFSAGGIEGRLLDVLNDVGGTQEIKEVSTLRTLVKDLPQILASLANLPDIGESDLLEKFQKNLDFLLQELPAIAAGGPIGENFKTALATFRSLIPEATQLKTVFEEELKLRQLASQNATFSLELLKAELAGEKEKRDLRAKGIEDTDALFIATEKIIDLERERLIINTQRALDQRRLEAAGSTFKLQEIQLQISAEEQLNDLRNTENQELQKLLPILELVLEIEKQRLKINQELARIQAKAALAQSENALEVLRARRAGQGTRGLQVEGLRGQIGSIGEQRAVAQQELRLLQDQGGSEAAILAKRAEIQAFSQEIAELEESILRLEGIDLEAFQIGLSEFIDSLPTKAEIALQAVTDFATRTADFFADTIGRGLKTLLTDGIDGLKEGVKELDTIFAQFFGQLLIDIGTAIIRSILLRTILAALPPGIGGFLGFNKGGPVVGLNDGGKVGGPPNVNRDVVPAMLTPGEFVVRREAVNAVGTEFLMGLNMMGRPSSRIGMSRPRLGSVASFNTGGGVTGLQSGGGASPTYVVANEENLQSLLSGGKNEMLNFLRDNRNNF